ncbi:hypothetical protein K7432_000102 [Basidiobolus ranarum]|uniref:Alanine dehydrogenase/pyridine nucleotide transhydrogenase NAD(H)-binding domain-containing protein n=1 Tax=Basidiobolus ranarum TaxID=34480 RepID=A0ABR2X511_9FUNG
MINCLHGIGQRLLGFGYNTPFLYVGMAHNYQSLADAKSTIQKVGKIIAEEGFPREFGPVVFTFTGSGSVSKGAQDVFSSLPHEYIKPSELEKLVKSNDFDNKKIYACEVTFNDYIQKKDGGPIVRDDYFKNPQNYTSNFHTKIAPYTTALVNGLFWSNEYPRLLTNEQLAELQSDDKNQYRMVSVADISCDIEGSLEFTTKTTTIDEPFFYYDAVNGNEHQDIEHTGTQVMSIDNLPTEIPAESSEHFSNALYPFAKELALGNFDHPTLKRATIAENGDLTPKHQHLQKKLSKSTNSGITVKSNEKNRVLLLGSGFVSAPLIDYFLRDENTEVTIASNQVQEATALANGRGNTRVTDLHVQDPEKLSGLVRKSDVVVSFVPAPFHPAVAQACIAEKKNMVTASYISPAMMALDKQAKQAGVSIINEIGLDPGIDHLTAMKIIDEVKRKNGRITSFISWCGGLPAPECSDNPLGYKFSWSPRGVLTAGLNDAQFKMNGKLHTIPGNKLLANYFPSVPIFPGFAFEGLANRDSLQYVDTYGLGPVEELDTMFRGTLRFKGYSDLMYAFSKIGMLSQESSHQDFDNWPAFLDSVIGNKGGDHNSRLSKISNKLELPQNHPMVTRVMSALSWLQMTKEAESLPKINTPTILDAFCTILSRKLQYNSHERDMVALHHEFGVERSDGKKEIHKSTLITYGAIGGYSGMAKTVALPAAITADLLLKGKINAHGVLSPTIPEIYSPVLSKLENEGIHVIEEVNQGAKSIKEQLSWTGSNYWQ